MPQITEKLKIVLLLSQNVYAAVVCDYLFKNQKDDFEIVGVVRQYFPKKEQEKKNLTFQEKLAEIFKNHNPLSAIFYLVFKRWFVSSNSCARNFFKKILPKKYIKFSSVDEAAKSFKCQLLITDDINNEKTKKFLENLKPDLGVICGTGIIKAHIFTIPKFGCVNYHAGIAPKYRGCEPIFWQLYYNDAVGYTLHKINEGVDTGEIILTKKIDYKKSGDLWKTMYNIKNIMSFDSAREIKKIISELKEMGEIKSYVQSSEGAYFFKHPKEEEKRELAERFKL